VNVFVLPTAELASECSRDVAVIRFVVATVRVACARIQKESPQARVLLPAMDAVERSASVALEKRMLTLVRTARMMVAGVSEKRRRIPIFLSAVFAVLAHVTCLSLKCLYYTIFTGLHVVRSRQSGGR